MIVYTNFLKPFSFILKELGQQIAEVFVLDSDTNQSLFVIQGNNGEKGLKVRIIEFIETLIGLFLLKTLTLQRNIALLYRIY